jgi:hypothetical protein
VLSWTVHLARDHPFRLLLSLAVSALACSAGYAVLGLLLDIRAKLKTYDAEVVVSSINPQLYRVFKITHLDRIFTIAPTAGSSGALYFLTISLTAAVTLSRVGATIGL